MFNRKPDLSDRARLRETRARPWLVNSVLSKVKKVTCKPHHVDTPSSDVVEQKAPSTQSVETKIFEEAVAKTYDDLSRSAKRISRIPRWVRKSRPAGCLKHVAPLSDDETNGIPTSSSRTTFLEGEGQVNTSRVPVPRRLVKRSRGKVETGTKFSLGDWTLNSTNLISTLSVIEEVSESGSSLDVPGNEVKFKPKVVKKVHFSDVIDERVIPYQIRTREYAPRGCKLWRLSLGRCHATCWDSYTCEQSTEDKPTARYNFSEWQRDQSRMGHVYFLEYGDILWGTYVTNAEGVISEDPEGTPLRSLEAINSL